MSNVNSKSTWRCLCCHGWIYQRVCSNVQSDSFSLDPPFKSWTLTSSCLVSLYSSTMFSMLSTIPSSDTHRRLNKSFMIKDSRRRFILKYVHSCGWKDERVFNVPDLVGTTCSQPQLTSGGLSDSRSSHMIHVCFLSLSTVTLWIQSCITILNVKNKLSCWF